MKGQLPYFMQSKISSTDVKNMNLTDKPFLGAPFHQIIEVFTLRRSRTFIRFFHNLDKSPILDHLVLFVLFSSVTRQFANK